MITQQKKNKEERGTHWPEATNVAHVTKLYLQETGFTGVRVRARVRDGFDGITACASPLLLSSISPPITYYSWSMRGSHSYPPTNRVVRVRVRVTVTVTVTVTVW